MSGGQGGSLHMIQQLLAKGRFSKAFRLIDSNGLASMTDARVVQQLKAKNGPRVVPLPGRFPDDLPPSITFNLEKFHDTYRQLKPLAGTGPEGTGMSTCTRSRQVCHTTSRGR